jgi:hypothetical protein
MQGQSDPLSCRVNSSSAAAAAAAAAAGLVAIEFSVLLPMSLDAFLAQKQGYIKSVASAASVPPSSVEVANVKETAPPTRREQALGTPSGPARGRRLAAAGGLVVVVDSVVYSESVSAEQVRQSVANRAVLDLYLHSNGLPASFQSSSTTASTAAAAGTQTRYTASDETDKLSRYGIIAGSAFAALVVAGGCFLYLRGRRIAKDAAAIIARTHWQSTNPDQASAEPEQGEGARGPDPAVDLEVASGLYARWQAAAGALPAAGPGVGGGGVPTASAPPLPPTSLGYEAAAARQVRDARLSGFCGGLWGAQASEGEFEGWSHQGAWR